jgi:hypothetical protein
MKEEILDLGKMLVNELGLDESVDTLSRWMAHYIAQQMIDVENSVGEERIKSEEKCFKTILKLWKHRAYFEHHKNPFERFEGIFKTLERLNPDKDEYLFFNQYDDHKLEGELEEDGIINNAMDMVMDIDKISRIWITYILKQAALCASDEKILEWLRLSGVEMDENLDSKVIIKLLEQDIEADKNINKEIIQERIKQLERFRRFNEELIRIYSEEL